MRGGDKKANRQREIIKKKKNRNRDRGRKIDLDR